jgi:hypothetical protein
MVLDLSLLVSSMSSRHVFYLFFLSRSCIFGRHFALLWCSYVMICEAIDFVDVVYESEMIEGSLLMLDFLLLIIYAFVFIPWLFTSTRSLFSRLVSSIV